MSEHSTVGQSGRLTQRPTGRRQASQGIQPVIEQQPDPGAHPLAGPRPPEYVIELWVSEQLRDGIRRNNAALAQDHQDAGRRRHIRKAEPQAELEAEP